MIIITKLLGFIIKTSIKITLLFALLLNLDKINIEKVLNTLRVVIMYATQLASEFSKYLNV